MQHTNNYFQKDDDSVVGHIDGVLLYRMCDKKVDVYAMQLCSIVLQNLWIFFTRNVLMKDVSSSYALYKISPSLDTRLWSFRYAYLCSLCDVRVFFC